MNLKKNFRKAHSLGCGYCGELSRKPGYLMGPVTYECPEYGSEYRPEQEIDGEHSCTVGLQFSDVSILVLMDLARE